MSAEPCRILATRLYDGDGGAPLIDHVVEIEGGRIAALRPAREADRRAGAAEVAEILAPGFIDLQINGAADVQFNFDPGPETLARIAAGARMGGTALCLPTFITAPGRGYLRAVEAGRAAIGAGVPGVLGLHLEGPFLSPERPGIHPAGAIRRPDDDDLAALTAPFPGPVLVTLAPEAQPAGAVAALARAGRIVFAGHSAATAADIGAAAGAGLSGATHLFNAMSQMTAREPGLVGAVLASEALFAGIIADGHHVAWENVRIAARLAPERLCLVTDAMLTLAGSRTCFDLGGREIHLAEGRLTDATGRLAGAHVAMNTCVRNMAGQGGQSLGAAIRMATRNPAAALGLDRELGRIAPGYRACLTELTNGLSVESVHVDGARFRPDGETGPGAPP